MYPKPDEGNSNLQKLLGDLVYQIDAHQIPLRGLSFIVAETMYRAWEKEAIWSKYIGDLQREVTGECRILMQEEGIALVPADAIEFMSPEVREKYDFLSLCNSGLADIYLHLIMVGIVTIYTTGNTNQRIGKIISKAYQLTLDSSEDLAIKYRYFIN
jgi:hypothetical protein